VDAALQNQAIEVLRMLSRARQLFGGDAPPADPPAFIAPAELEDNLGGGWYR
jgi:hypothetical protein